MESCYRNRVGVAAQGRTSPGTFTFERKFQYFLEAEEAWGMISFHIRYNVKDPPANLLPRYIAEA